MFWWRISLRSFFNLHSFFFAIFFYFSCCCVLLFTFEFLKKSEEIGWRQWVWTLFTYTITGAKTHLILIWLYKVFEGERKVIFNEKCHFGVGLVWNLSHTYFSTSNIGSVAKNTPVRPMCLWFRNSVVLFFQSISNNHAIRYEISKDHDEIKLFFHLLVYAMETWEQHNNKHIIWIWILARIHTYSYRWYTAVEGNKISVQCVDEKQSASWNYAYMNFNYAVQSKQTSQNNNYFSIIYPL